jgi:hypothetical protein
MGVLQSLAAFGLAKQALLEPLLPLVPGPGLLPFLPIDCLPAVRPLLLPWQNNWNADILSDTCEHTVQMA